MTVFIRNAANLAQLLKASKIRDGNENLKKCYFNAFSGPFKIYVFYKVQKFHNPQP
jgi:hypothetical protein